MPAADPAVPGLEATGRQMARDGGAGSHLRAALDGVSVGLATFDRRLEILFANDRLAGTLEIRADVLRRATALLDLLEGSAALNQAVVQRLHEICLQVVASGQDHGSTVLVEAAQGPRLFAVQVTALRDGHWMALFEEVTARHAAEARAIEIAMRDPLTGLPNRQLFHERSTTALAQAAVVGPAIMLVDLDRFKVVNDTLGHPVGDSLLRLVSRRLTSVLREADLVARLGGDEFALLIAPGCDAAGVAALARRIVDMLGRPYLIDGHLVHIGASAGVAIAPADGRDPVQLLCRADLALYDAKHAGRGGFSFFMPEMDARAAARRALEIDLRRALPLGEFELHYQPQIDLEADAIVGFEALLRWRHRERGLVEPADFLPLAEEFGLIVGIGEWVLREACREARRWPGALSVAVNISSQQFENTTRLVEAVAEALTVSGLPAHRLELEITERVLLGREATVLAALHQLRMTGVRVAMDDFGTGYSSLSQLHSFPFDKIKIDRSFIGDRGEVASQNAIIRAIAALGASLGMTTIAEGIETPAQLDRIRAEGCNSVQGYLFSRPVPVQQVRGLIAEFSGRGIGGPQPVAVMSAP